MERYSTNYQPFRYPKIRNLVQKRLPLETAYSQINLLHIFMLCFFKTPF
jgi:hypothetical protein